MMALDADVVVVADSEAEEQSEEAYDTTWIQDCQRIYDDGYKAPEFAFTGAEDNSESVGTL
jgi:hypothetical protein